MQRWNVRDSQGHEIYLTAERWDHIQDHHPELIGRLDDVLDAIRRGRREQDAILPNKYTYINRWEDRWPEYNCLQRRHHREGHFPLYYSGGWQHSGKQLCSDCLASLYGVPGAINERGN